MAGRAWSHEELILAMNLYCQLPFGKLHARNPQVIALADRLARTPASVAMKLCNLASLDPAHQQRGVRGLSKVSAADRQVWEEFHADWNRLAAESEQLRTRPPSAAFSGDTETSRLVQVRLAQRFFRRSVLASYGGRCCVSDIPVSRLLIASHIVPWSDYPAERANPRNGLCLSRLHDGAFDAGLIAFDDDCRLVLSQELRDAVTNDVLRTAFQRHEGHPLRQPEKFQPDPALLAAHRQTIFRG